MRQSVRRPSPGPLYRARGDLKGNVVVAKRTSDPQVLELVRPRRWIRWGGTTLPCQPAGAR